MTNAEQATDALIAQHRSGCLSNADVLSEIEHRAILGDRHAQHYIGWNLED